MMYFDVKFEGKMFCHGRPFIPQTIKHHGVKRNAPANAFSHIIQQMADNASFSGYCAAATRQVNPTSTWTFAELDGRIQAN